MQKCKQCGCTDNLRLLSTVRYKGKTYRYYKCADCKKRGGHVEKNAASVRRWRERNPEKDRARKLTYVAIRNGTLVKEPCFICGEDETEAHHHDYKKPLEVVWLCKKHHQEADKIRRKYEVK